MAMKVQGGTFRMYDGSGTSPAPGGQLKAQQTLKQAETPMFQTKQAIDKLQSVAAQTGDPESAALVRELMRSYQKLASRFNALTGDSRFKV